MKFFVQSFTSLFLAAWILVGSLGISWTEETCVFSGAKKSTFSKAASCCENPLQAHLSRAKCCLLDKYQVKFNFDLTKGNNNIIFAFSTTPLIPKFVAPSVIYQEQGSLSHPSNAPPLARQVRLAQLQTYLI
jgi:hypothetical protein